MLLKRIIKDFISTQFLRFLLVGGFAALVNFFSRFFFRQFFLYVVSVAFAFSVGTIISFILNKIFTFKSFEERTVVQLIKFIIIAISSIFLATFIAWLGMVVYRLLQISFISSKQMESIAHIIAIGVTTLYNFLTMKYFSFRKLK